MMTGPSPPGAGQAAQGEAGEVRGLHGVAGVARRELPHPARPADQDVQVAVDVDDLDQPGRDDDRVRRIFQGRRKPAQVDQHDRAPGSHPRRQHASGTLRGPLERGQPGPNASCGRDVDSRMRSSVSCGPDATAGFPPATSQFQDPRFARFMY
jgi:hypothetical protein